MWDRDAALRGFEEMLMTRFMSLPLDFHLLDTFAGLHCAGSWLGAAPVPERPGEGMF
jgi:hypothetical protein